MDVRCEKCQTEYELDESRLKPTGVTVKCTNCGHMFKIRKRTNTNVGVPTIGSDRAKSGSNPPKPQSDRGGRADSVLAVNDQGSGPNSERQWYIRLENGDQKQCRELATLQQWIVAGVVTRESLISRSGKTWKRLGDISELVQYFTIADEAKQQRSHRPTNKPVAPTMLGVGGKVAAGGTVMPDEDEGRATGNFRARTGTPPPPPPARTPPMGSPQGMPPAKGQPNPAALAQTDIAPPIAKKPPTQPPPGQRATGAWVASDIKHTDSMAQMPQGPQGGKLSAIPDEPAFAGRVRIQPADESSFTSGRVDAIDDDDDLIPGERGSRAGMWIAVIAMLVIGAAAGVVYVVVFGKKKTKEVATVPQDAPAAVATPDAPAVVVTPIDAAAVVAPQPTALETARLDLGANADAALRKSIDALATAPEPAAQAMRARLHVALAQSLLDRAGLVEKAEADKLRKDSKQLVLDASPLAQKAQKALPDDPIANLAMADVLRMQAKVARDVKRYIDQGRAKADKDGAREVAIAEAMLAYRDGKLDDAAKQLTDADTDPGDVRPKLWLALVAFAQNRVDDAKSYASQVVATQPEHATALALQKKLETTVATTDPLPPEDGPKAGSGSATRPKLPGDNLPTGNDYDSLLARANKIAETNCTKAIDIFAKALEQKPNGVEALTGMGYCHIDAKQFASAFSKFRAALAVSARYEPALGGVAEAYQQMGRKEQAIEAWKAYLEIYPGSAKAKRQLEILGAGDTPKPPDEKPPPEKPPEKPPETPPPPTPTPTPTPAPAGSGT